MAEASRPLALVTGASTGIGFELARMCATNGFDLIIAADEPAIHEAAEKLRETGASVEPVETDLSTRDGVDRLVAAASQREVHALLANAGRGLGGAFLDQDFNELKRVIDTNVTGTLYLVQKVARDMRSRKKGRILVTGSIAGFLPGTYQAVYNGTKALLDSFSYALRAELKGSGVTVTCLMPGATDTDFFGRAHMEDTEFAVSRKQRPEEVARSGFKAMMRGDAGSVTGWSNKLMVALAGLVPGGVLAEYHRKKAAPGSAEQQPQSRH